MTKRRNDTVYQGLAAWKRLHIMLDRKISYNNFYRYTVQEAYKLQEKYTTVKR